MDVPITLAIALAVGTSLYETMMSGHHAYFDAAIMLCFFLLGGRYLDHRTRASARSAAQELAALEVPRALRVTAAGEETVAAAELAVGDIVRVKPGGRIPVDGIVTEGQSELDRSLMTGESLPVYAGPGTAVSAGEVNLTGPLMVEVRAAGRDTSLHRIADLVAVAESGRANYNSLADKAAKLYAPGVHILAVLAAVGWWLYTQDLRISLNIAAAVLIITCPCALGLAVPAVTTAASGRLFRKGLLIKDGTALERLAEADTVVFDKTGTLTTGAPEPVGLDHHPEDAMRVALALAEASSHPLAEALSSALRANGLRPARVEGVTEAPGYGVEGTWRGQTVRLGRAAWLGAEAPDVTATFLKIGDDAPRTIRFTDTLRDGAAETVAALKAAGRRVILLSGDTRGAVEAFAARIGIEEVIAEALPQEKAALVAELSGKGREGPDGGRRAERHRRAGRRACLDLAGLRARRGAHGVGHGADGPEPRAHRGCLHDLHLRGAAHPRELHHRHGLQRAGRALGHRRSRHAADRRLGDVDVFHYGLAQRIAVEVSP
jgi:Cu2+-exporting ATPase